MQSFQVRALDLARAFREAKRTDDSHFFMLPDSSPVWMQNLIREAHDDEFPNDWRFAKCREIALWLHECESLDAAREDAMEAADSMSFPYTGKVLSWYSEIPSRLDYCDQYKEEFGSDAADTVMLLLYAGHAFAIERMIHTIISACEARSLELFPV